MATTEFIAAIELSSSKATGIAGRKNSDGSIEILAYAREDAAPFVHKGNIYNIDKAAHTLASLKGRLEEQLGHPIAQVYTSIGGQSLRTVSNTVSRTLNEESIISPELVDAITDENLGTHYADMCVLDVAPQEYKIDNALHADPVGVTGTQVTGQFLNIMARASVKKNLELSFEQAGIALADLFVAPTALAKAALTEAEMRSGCALVDFGADTTTLQVYKNNLLRYLCVLPLGGNNITRDIATLKMEEEDAEHLKLAYGNALPDEEAQPQDEDEHTTCTLPDGRAIELSTLDDIVGARAEEIAANVWHQIELSGYADKLFAGIVLTGGGSNLKNLDNLLRKTSKLDKVKTAPFVHTDIREAQCTLPKDGTQCTLLGLLALGDDNCCAEEPEEKPQTDTTSESPEQKTLFDDDEDLKRQIEEAKHQAEIRRKQEEEDRKRKKKKYDKDNHQSQGGNSNWFTSILNKGKSIFDDDEDTKMN